MLRATGTIGRTYITVYAENRTDLIAKCDKAGIDPGIPELVGAHEPEARTVKAKPGKDK